MKKVLTFLLFSAIGISLCKAQTASNINKNKDNSINGTYQLQVINSRNQPLIPANLNQLVLQNRDANQVKYVPLGTEVRLMVLPLSEINKPDFKPLRKIAHITVYE